MIWRGVPLLVLAAALGARAGDDDKPTPAVFVHVVSAGDSKPVAGARVVLRARDVELATARTDAAGDAELRSAWAADAFVEASAAGRGCEVARLASDVPRSGEPWFGSRAHATRIDLTLGPGAPLRGRVIDDADGKSVEHARVIVVPTDWRGAGGQGRADLTFAQTFADASGAFVFEGVNPGDIDLYVFARGYAIVERWLGSVRTPQSFHLERAGTIRLCVLHGDGKPFAGASIEWESQSAWSPDGDGPSASPDDRMMPTTDADGRLEFPHAAFGIRHIAGLRMGTNRHWLREDEAADLLIVTVGKPILDVVVRPENEDSSPPVSLFVAVERVGSTAAPEDVVADLAPLDSDWPIAYGHGLPLRFDGVAPGRYRLHVIAKNAPDWTGDVEIDSAKRPTRTIVRLGGTETVAGLVVDDRGEPVAGVAVEWGPSGWSAEPRFGGNAGVSGADGSFRVTGLAPGRIRLRVRSNRYEDAPSVWVSAPTKDARLVVPRTGVVTLRVAAPPGSPLPEWLWCRDAAVDWKDGVASLTLDAGRRHVELGPRRPDREYLPIVFDADVKPGETLDLGSVTFDRGVSASGVVLGSDGRPTEAEIDDRADAGTASKDDGRFAITPLPHATVTLRARCGTDVAETTFDAAHPPKEVVLRLIRTRMVRIEAGRRAVPQSPWFRIVAAPRGATNDAWPLPLPQLDRAAFHGTLDVRGVACLRLPPGEWTLRAVGENDSALATTDVVVAADGDRAVRVTLPVK